MSEGPTPTPASVLLVTTTSLPAEASATLLPTLAAPTATRTRAPTINASAACQPLALSYYDKFRPVFLEFSDALKVANATSRIALGTPVGEMQRIKRDAESIDSPACVSHARSLLVGGMDNVISAFIDFMADAGDTIIERKMSQGLLDMINGIDQLEALAKGLPTPVPQKLPTNTPVPTPFPTPTALRSGSAIIVTDGDGNDWQVRVERVEVGQAFSFDGKTEKASGRFALLFLEITNRGLSPGIFLSFGTIELVDASGRSYGTHLMGELYAQIAYGMESSCIQVNPDATVHCLAVFDVPQGGVYALAPGVISKDQYTPRVEVVIP